jgi:plasmid stabilization system protein ParE
MNRFTVVYLAEAEENVIAIWADAADRNLVTEAVDAADRLFAENPLQASVHLSEQLRRRDIPPLRFYFEVREDDRMVAISNVARLPR